MAKLVSMTLRLPESVNRKLEKAVESGKAAAKIELIRRAVDEFIERHPEMFSD